jgi:hypothetical protein
VGYFNTFSQDLSRWTEVNHENHLSGKPVPQYENLTLGFPNTKCSCLSLNHFVLSLDGHMNCGLTLDHKQMYTFRVKRSLYVEMLQGDGWDH